ncbi:hypothetical protein C8R43DRAFT_949308 [Mycena crocata]|nr:hypothetical protein C8R43DRAFT_949308 [Mycena crocata]
MTHPQDSDSGSESDISPPTRAPPKKPRRSSDDLSGNTTLPTRTCDKSSRKPSERQDITEKENLELTQQKLAAAEKSAAKLRTKMKKLEAVKESARDDDNDAESEEKYEDEGVSFTTSLTSIVITPMGRLPTAPARPTAIFRTVNKAASTDAPKVSARAYKRMPELNIETQHQLDSTPPRSPTRYDVNDKAMAVDVPSDTKHPPSSSAVHLDLAQERARSSGSGSKCHCIHGSPPPPTKRARPKALEAKFRPGFVIVKGVKPKAGDYETVPEGLLLCAMAEYSVRILTINGFPPITLQVQWANETFRNACESAKVRYICTDRMNRLITKRGSHICGKILDGFRPVFASHYGFQRTASKPGIRANKDKSEKLMDDTAFHYKNKSSLGAIFRLSFNPIPAAYLALDFTVLEFLAREWSTGTHIVAKFTEKDNYASYETPLNDVKNWCALRPAVTKIIRRKWFKRATETLGLEPASAVAATRLDEAQLDALRLELAGRTGETDSEPEIDDAPV